MERVSYEKVSAVSDQLKKEGQNITVKAIRGELGMGSNSTILKHLQKWKAFEEEKQNASIKKSFSDEFTTAIEAEIKRHITEIRQSLQKEIDDARAGQKEALTILTETEQKLAESVQENGNLQQKINIEIERLDLERKAHKKMSLELEKERKAAENTRLTAAEFKVKSEVTENSYNNVIEENQILKKKIENLTTALHKNETTLAVVTVERDGLKSEIKRWDDWQKKINQKK